MKIKADWISHLQRCREREVEMVFARCPRKAFATGLELGAGSGFQSQLLAQYVDRLVSTDFSAVHLPRNDTESITYQVCDAEEADHILAPQHFDFIFSSNLLEHLPNPQRALRAVSNLLTNDGITIHVIPSPFWKLCHLALYLPNRCVTFLEKVMRDQSKHSGDDDEVPAVAEAANNPKTRRKKRSPLIELLIPEPHGVSETNLAEFVAFNKTRWIREFEDADLDIIAIVRGPVVSGYGFGFDNLRKLLERLGLSSEYAYIARKKGAVSPYVRYFE